MKRFYFWDDKDTDKNKNIFCVYDVEDEKIVDDGDNLTYKEACEYREEVVYNQQESDHITMNEYWDDRFEVYVK